MAPNYDGGSARLAENSTPSDAGESTAVAAMRYSVRRTAAFFELPPMTFRAILLLAAGLTLSAALGEAQGPAPTAPRPYSAQHTGDVVQLQDSVRKTVVSILPSVGNIVFEMRVKGQNVLRWPYASLEEFKSRPGLNGLPLLAPWANRLDEQAFYANGKRYAFDMSIGNVRGAIPIHGFLSQAAGWQLVEMRADASSAWVTSRLDFYKQPAWMKQFPFAHTIEVTHRLRDGSLEVQTTLVNMSAEPMPVSIGFHPYFQLTDSARDDWTISVPARTRWLLGPNKVPIGSTEAIERFMQTPQKAALKDYDLDDVFGDLVRDDRGRATVTVRGRQQRLDVVMGPKWRALVIYSPLSSSPSAGASPHFICFEPMAGITDAMNLAERRLYNELQYVQPGSAWRESFWIRTGGF
jgi:aldose 1-epimerase